MHLRSLTLALTGVSLLAAGCSAGTADSPNRNDVTVVATTTVMGSLASGLTDCAGGSTETLMSPGTDPHEFALSSRQVADLAQADLVVANGLGLEEGLADTLESVEADGVDVLEIAPLVDPIPFAGAAHDEHAHGGSHDTGQHEKGEHEGKGEDHQTGEGHEEHEHGSQDPHVWHDAGRMATAATLLGDELAERTGDDRYAECGDEEHDRLMALDAEVRDTLATVPAERRVLVTDHDAFGYFANAYDFEVAGTVIPSPSTLAKPSSSELAELVGVVESEGVPAIFSNNAANPALVEQVAAEAGADISVVELFVGSLGPDGSGADTYAGMMTTNAERIAEALGGGEGGSS